MAITPASARSGCLAMLLSIGTGACGTERPPATARVASNTPPRAASGAPPFPRRAPGWPRSSPPKRCSRMCARSRPPSSPGARRAAPGRPPRAPTSRPSWIAPASPRPLPVATRPGARAPRPAIRAVATMHYAHRRQGGRPGTSGNVYGIVRGRRADEVLVVGAHLDYLGAKKRRALPGRRGRRLGGGRRARARQGPAEEPRRARAQRSARVLRRRGDRPGRSGAARTSRRRPSRSRRPSRW